MVPVCSCLNDRADAHYLRVYVRQLRQKIEADPERPQFVLTERPELGIVCARETNDGVG